MVSNRSGYHIPWGKGQNMEHRGGREQALIWSITGQERGSSAWIPPGDAERGILGSRGVRKKFTNS
jgi:hypothetical protein